MLNNIDPTQSQENSVCLNLHGKSYEDAENAVDEFIEQAISKKIKKVIIITGRGNHVNSDNIRGVLYRNLPTWLKNRFRIHIYHIIQMLGSFEIVFSQPAQDLTSALPKFPKLPTLSKKVLSKYKNNPLMLAIAKNAPLEEIEATLMQAPKCLTRTCRDGTTVLMVAAGQNRIDVMEFLLQQDNLCTVPFKLLKQTTDDGSTVLMKAIQHKCIEAINYLLTKAPSLLKKKTKDDISCFEIAAKTDEPVLMLKCLGKHLKPHKHERDRGYTGLFREYKVLMQMFPENYPDKRKIPIFRKPVKGIYNWFFMDRIVAFLKKHERSNKSLKKYLMDIRSHKTNKEQARKLRNSLSILLRHDADLRRLFLRFNNAQKPVSGRKFKHAIDLRPVLSETRVQFSNRAFRKKSKSLRKKSIFSNIGSSLASVSQSRFTAIPLIFSRQRQNLNSTANQKFAKKKNRYNNSNVHVVPRH